MDASGNHGVRERIVGSGQLAAVNAHTAKTGLAKQTGFGDNGNFNALSDIFFLAPRLFFGAVFLTQRAIDRAVCEC